MSIVITPSGPKVKVVAALQAEQAKCDAITDPKAKDYTEAKVASLFIQAALLQIGDTPDNSHIKTRLQVTEIHGDTDRIWAHNIEIRSVDLG